MGGGLAMCKKPPRYHSDDDMNFQISGMNRPRQGRGRGASPNHLMDSDEIPQCEILMESVDHPQCASWEAEECLVMLSVLSSRFFGSEPLLRVWIHRAVSRQRAAGPFFS